MDIDERELKWLKKIVAERVSDAELVKEIHRILDESIEAARFLAEGVEVDWCRQELAIITFNPTRVLVTLPDGKQFEGDDLLSAASNARGDWPL